MAAMLRVLDATASRFKAGSIRCQASSRPIREAMRGEGYRSFLGEGTSSSAAATVLQKILGEPTYLPLLSVPPERMQLQKIV